MTRAWPVLKQYNLLLSSREENHHRNPCKSMMNKKKRLSKKYFGQPNYLDSFLHVDPEDRHAKKYIFESVSILLRHPWQKGLI